MKFLCKTFWIKTAEGTDKEDASREAEAEFVRKLNMSECLTSCHAEENLRGDLDYKLNSPSP